MTMDRSKSVRAQKNRSPRIVFGRALLLPALLLLMTLITTRSYGQVLYGSLVGTVTDSSGAIIVGADVSATQLATNEIRTGKTNESGDYTLSNIPSGTYRIIVTKAGFQEYQVQSVNVAFNATVRVDAKLGVGTSTQTVTVNAETAQLQTDRADVNQEVSSQELLQIPQPTRTYEGLLGTVAGVAPPIYNALKTNNVDRGMQLQADGTSTSSTDVRIEGVSAAQGWTPYNSALTPSVEAIDTVSMVTGSAEASQTLASGSTVNIQLKSGTNQFHGEAYEYHIDNLWAARPFFQPTGSLAKNTDNDFGGTVGGPILKNKLFFFTSYEGDWTGKSVLFNATVPTTAMLNGDFTAGGTCATKSSAPACTTLYDPTSATDSATGQGKVSFISEYGSNQIPAGMISSNVKQLLALYAPLAAAEAPIPGVTGASDYLYNYRVAFATPQSLQKSDTKIDWDATSKLRITGRFNYHPYNIGYPASGPATLFDTGTPNHSYGNTYATTIAATYLARPNLVIDGSWGLTHSTETISPPFGTQKYGAATLGIPGTQLSPLPVGGGLPNFSFGSGYTELGYQYSYLHYSDPIFVYAANATLTHGANTFKVGFLANQLHINHIEPPGAQGVPDGFTFGGNATTGYGLSASQFNAFADFLLGDPSSWQNSFQPNNVSKMDSLQYSAYVTNTQQIGHKLTVNYGTSWAYFPVGSHGSYGPENLNFSDTGGVITPISYEICGNQGIAKTCGIKSSWALLGPHLGLSYRITPSFVVRAGASITPEQFNFWREFTYNYPESTGYSASAPNSWTGVGNWNSASGALATGVPVITPPSFSRGVLTLPAGAIFNAVPHNLQRGYTNSWNLSLQKELGPWLAQAAYVGNTAVHIHNVYPINYATLGGGSHSGALYTFNGTTSTAQDAILPLGHTNYNSLQSTIQRSFKGDYQVRVSYTYSKWLGLCCDSNGFQALGTPIPQYMRLNYSVMPGDRRHNLAITGTAVSPFGQSKPWMNSGAAAYILGGWQLSAEQVILTGMPVNVQELAIDSFFNTPGSTERPDLAKPKVVIHPGQYKNYIDSSSYGFVDVTSGPARFGTAPYDSAYGPGAANLDASLFRSFSYRERYKLQLRAEAFNVTNSPHFGQPSQYFGLPGFGQITSTSGISRATDSRYFRFGAKLLF